MKILKKVISIIRKEYIPPLIECSFIQLEEGIAEGSTELRIGDALNQVQVVDWEEGSNDFEDTLNW